MVGSRPVGRAWMVGPDGSAVVVARHDHCRCCCCCYCCRRVEVRPEEDLERTTWEARRRDGPSPLFAIVAAFAVAAVRELFQHHLQNTKRK